MARHLGGVEHLGQSPGEISSGSWGKSESTYTAPRHARCWEKSRSRGDGGPVVTPIFAGPTGQSPPERRSRRKRHESLISSHPSDELGGRSYSKSAAPERSGKVAVKDREVCPAEASQAEAAIRQRRGADRRRGTFEKALLNEKNRS